MKQDSLGDRMKKYEKANQTTLIKRVPVIIRVDGKAFHTYTKQFKDDSAMDPFNDIMHLMMINTMGDMVDAMQCAKFAYTQSDEISILLTDWDQLSTEMWFGGKIQKIVSVAASLATGHFNKYAHRFNLEDQVALFDARVFQLPKEDVANYFIWRQKDATRNSVQMLGRHFFSHKNMQGKKNEEIQEMIFQEHGINWNDIAVWKRRGTSYDQDGFDNNIPIFTEDRAFIEDLLLTDS